MSGALMQAAAALALVGALLLARRTLARGRGAGGAAVRVRERHALSRDAGIALVSWSGDDFLVGWSPRAVTVLSRRAGPPAEGSP